MMKYSFVRTMGIRRMRVSVTLSTAMKKPAGACTARLVTNEPARSGKRRASPATSGVSAAHANHSVNDMRSVSRHCGG